MLSHIFVRIVFVLCTACVRLELSVKFTCLADFPRSAFWAWSDCPTIQQTANWQSVSLMKSASARRRDTESVEDSASASGRILSYQRLQPDSSPKTARRSGTYADSGKVAVYSSRARQRARAAADPHSKSGTPRSGDSQPSCSTIRPRLSTMSLHQIHHYHNQHPNFLDHHGICVFTAILLSCSVLLPSNPMQGSLLSWLQSGISCMQPSTYNVLLACCRADKTMARCS